LALVDAFCTLTEDNVAELSKVESDDEETKEEGYLAISMLEEEGYLAISLLEEEGYLAISMLEEEGYLAISMLDGYVIDDDDDDDVDVDDNDD